MFLREWLLFHFIRWTAKHSDNTVRNQLVERLDAFDKQNWKPKAVKMAQRLREDLTRIHYV